MSLTLACVLSDHASSVLIVAKRHELVYRLGMAKYKASRVFPAGDIRGSESAARSGVVRIRQWNVGGQPVVDGRYGF